MSDADTQARARLIAKAGVGAVALLTTLVMSWEGYRARVYSDPIGRLAVCYGHDDPTLTPGAAYTGQECRAFLDADLLLHAQVLDCVSEPQRSALTDGQKAALVSFAFNVGVSKACGSTFVKRLGAGEGRAACAELSRWVYASGPSLAPKVLPGLVKRRADERRMCQS
jgi:lysozyme